MRKLLLGLLFVFAFSAVPLAQADEAEVNTGVPLPEIAPVDDAPIPALDAPAQE